MRVFLRYITKNMLEKKGRFFLLIFSITISTALLVFSMGTVDVILDGYTDTLKAAADGKDVGLYSNTDDPFFDENDFDAAGLTNFEGRLTVTGILNEDNEITYIGVNGLKDCNYHLTEGSVPQGSDEAVCVISDRIADERGLSIGSVLELNINGESHPFTVKAISAPKGLFYGDGKQSFDIIVPYEHMNKLLNADGKYNQMRAETSIDSVKAAKKFNDVNENVSATSLTDLSDAKTQVASIQSLVYMMFAIVCVVCCIIIHGAFKLIITERLTVIGTFMSQGATRKKISHILLMEAFMYGLVASVFGVALGEVILYFITRMTSPLRDYGIYMPFHVRASLIITGIIFSIAICVFSAWSPVGKIKKLPVKDVILNRMETSHKKGMLVTIIGCVLLGFSLLGAFSNAEWTEGPVSIILIAAAVLGVGMVLRKFLKGVAGCLANIFRKKTAAFLAFNNIKSVKLLRSNITLMVIAFSSILCIASAGSCLTKVVTAAYEDLDFDYEVYNIIDSHSERSTTDMLLEKLGELDCINADTLLTDNFYQVKVKDKLFIAEGADPMKYADYNKYLNLKSKENIEGLEKLAASTGDEALVSKHALKSIKKKVGDTITINVNGKDQDIKVIGTFDAKLYNNGDIVFFNEPTFKRVFHTTEAYSISFKVNGDLETAEEEFKPLLAKYGATYQSWEDMRDENVRGNAQLITLLKVFGYLALIVASIGILNNIAISFQQRRREFAVMASLGLDAKSRKRLVFTENMFCVIVSIALSLPYTMLLCRLFTKVLILLNIPLEMTLDWKSVIPYSLALAFVIFIASLSTMKKSKKLSVVQEIKYE